MVKLFAGPSAEAVRNLVLILVVEVSCCGWLKFLSVAAGRNIFRGMDREIGGWGNG